MRLIFRGLMVLIVVMLFYVGLRVNVMKTGYEIEALKREGENLEQMHNSLLIERAALTSMERVEKIATSHLGMRRPDKNQIVFVKEETEGGVRTALAKAGVSDKYTKNPLKVAKYFDWRL